ncbi:hypothetical protein Lal_00045018 [Lupinus albus]|nr:hypothetical protein Lal_00045018 [Lupinus albus]
MTRRNTSILHSINPEIDRTYHSDSVHSVAFPNFDHSVHYENMAQPPTPPGPPRQDLHISSNIMIHPHQAHTILAPDWTPPFDLECDIAFYALGTVLTSYEFDFLPP